MTFEEMILARLEKEQDDRDTRTRSGMWNPSSLGRCYRNQFFNRKNEPETEPKDLGFLKRMKLGKFIHQYAQGCYPIECSEKKVMRDNLLGYYDLVYEGKVIDIKSVSEWEFKRISVKGYDVEKQKETNCLQVCSYAWMAGFRKAGLVFIGICSELPSREFEIDVDRFIPKIEEELKVLNEYWDKKELPPAIPRAYFGKDCQYCGWRTKCNQLEGKI